MDNLNWFSLLLIAVASAAIWLAVTGKYQAVASWISQTPLTPAQALSQFSQSQSLKDTAPARPRS